MKFSETVKLTRPELVVGRRHEAWLEANDELFYSEKAIAFASAQLLKKGRDRRGTVSASSLGECTRYQQFTFLGMPRLQPTTQNLARMHNGTFMHLRWQMEGLTEGWLKAAEVPIAKNGWLLHGTMDGIAHDESVVELKSINLNGFSRVNTFGPLIPHLFQMATYMLTTERAKGVFLYECKDNQEYAEIVVGRDDVPIAEVANRAREVWNLIETKRLEEPLGRCLDREGYIYASCPFRDRCLQVRSWEEVA